MDTFNGFELRELQLSLPFVCRRRDELLKRCGLGVENADYAVGIFDSEENLVATASLDGDIIKGVAVDDSVRGDSLASTLVTAIMNRAAEEGIENLKVFTKPEYEDVFHSLTFATVGKCERVVLLEQDKDSLQRYKEYLASLPRKGKVGCVIMNANPMTIGHYYLIEQASVQVDTLFVIPVADDLSTEFSYDERVAILRDATSGFSNVKVIEGSHYAVSRSTFPSYFIKKTSDITEAHVALDLDIFSHHIAPSLGVEIRFVGTEPDDELTASYNYGMRRILPGHGIKVCEIERLKQPSATYGNGVVSASKVREFLNEGKAGEAFQIVPKSTIPYLLSHAAAWALRAELNLTPKPGLVDRDNSGAHADMDYGLMTGSIEALISTFNLLAALAIGPVMPSASIIKAVGMEGERRMMAVTGGVNTHRGALFSLGLAVVGAARLIGRGEKLTIEGIRSIIRSVAENFPRAEGTHGAGVAIRYGIPTALDVARAGYAEAVEALSEASPERMLLRLMSRLEDSNIYHRCGAEIASEVKRQAAEALSLPDDMLKARMKEMDIDFIKRRISPGGSADMLALTLFFRSVLAGNGSDESL